MPAGPDPPTGSDSPAPQVVLAHVSDLHIGAHLPAAAAALAADVARADPTLTVLTGDLTMRARPAQLDAARDLIDLLPAPRLVVLGNHDMPLLDLRARLLHPYDRYLSAIDSELDPVCDLPGLRVLGLESMPRWRWKSGRVSRRQTDLVVDVLDAAPPGALRVLALHHPPSLRGLATLAGRKRLATALARARVDLVLAGHTHVPAADWLATPHQPTAGDTHRTVQVVAGTAISTRLRGMQPSWTLIRAEPATIDVQTRWHGPDGWRTGATRRFPRAGPASRQPTGRG
jgi:3',5'-cyclic AMP phosphodiesterase CpdA